MLPDDVELTHAASHMSPSKHFRLVNNSLPHRLHVISQCSDSNSTLSPPTSLRGLVGGGGGLRFKVCLSVLLRGEGRRGAAAR